tara:strand:+ start:50 stop:406 length:357 start_codon:yes stop_codon:yes gene_type:complete
MKEKEKEGLRLVRAFNEEWICPHYVILGHFSKKRDQKESHPPSFLFFVSFCSLEFLSFFLDFASFFTLFGLFRRFPISSFFIEDTFSIALLLLLLLQREREKEREKRERDKVRKFESE